MEPISAITGALLAGAIAASKDIATAEIKSAFAAVKERIAARLGPNAGNAERLTAEPHAESAKLLRPLVESDLQQTGAAKDEALLAAVADLTAALEKLPKEQATRAGLHLEDIEAARSVILERLNVRGDVTVRGARAKDGDFVLRDTTIGTGAAEDTSGN